MATNQTVRRYATKGTAAEYMACSVRMIDKMLAQGDIPGYRVGRAVRVDLNELDAYMAGR